MRFMTHGTVPTISFFPELLQVVMAKYGMMSTHRKTYEKCEACNKKFRQGIQALSRGNCRRKKTVFPDTVWNLQKNTYRLKKGNTYLLVIFTPDSFRFRKKITNGNNYYKEQYLSDIPWSFDLKITYMDEKSRLAKLPYCIRNQNVVQCIRIEKKH